MKKYVGILVITLAVASSAFTSIRHNVSTQVLEYTSNDLPPSSSPNNMISAEDFLSCPTDATSVICGEKWDVTDPANPVRLETRFENHR